MRVDALSLKLRPRPMGEAADLGVRLVMTNAASVWLTFLPVFGIAAVLALATVEVASWLPGLIIFWLKPWFDRTLLFALSRAVFGESTRFADLWQARSAVLWRRLPSTLTIARLSPWRAYTQPMSQLEGQSGATGRKRRAQLLNGKRGAASMAQFVFANLEIALCIGAIGIAVLFAPEGSRLDVLDWLRSESQLLSLAFGTLYAGAVLVLEPFFVGAGFVMYLNRRVELEGWDIEQEFRRAFAA